MDFLAEVAKIVKSLFQVQAFWSAIMALGSIFTLYLIYKQIANSRKIAAYEFLRREDDRFRTETMRRDRSKLAKTLLQCPENFVEIDKYADYVLDYFEDIGLMLRNNLAPKHFIWTMNCYYVLPYWNALFKYIQWVRIDRNDPTYYSDFEYLYRTMLKFEKRKTKNKRIEFTSQDLREFLREELHVSLRQSSKTDIHRIMKIENMSFKDDAYPISQFEDLYREHPEDFLVAEILGEMVGYSVGYISDGKGELDSIAIDPQFKHLGIGKTLTESIISRFRERDIKTCTLEVKTTNTAAIRFYEKLGFKISETLRNYYNEGSHAYLMSMDIEKDWKGR